MNEGENEGALERTGSNFMRTKSKAIHDRQTSVEEEGRG